MFSSNRSLVISTLLTGTAVATGTLIYGAYFGEQDELVILNDSLPPVIGNGLLPPPATYVMKTPPPADIPGVRRLKIARPSLETNNDEEEGTSRSVAASDDDEFYLTGTRSAELIRAPVEARIETFPTISLEEAVEGALAVDEWGFQVVQSYLSQAMGDGDALKARMDAILTRIEEEAGNYDLATISDAANLIIEAGARTHWTAFMAPFVLDESFKLKEGAMGWDFGPNHLEPYDKFTRVSSDSKMLVGDQMSSEGDRQGPSILRNGVHNVEQFVATGLKNGRYRVVILTAPRPNGRSPLYPFGVDVKRNGGKVNIVDTRSTDGIVPVMKLSEGGVGRLSDAPNTSAPSPEEASTSDNSLFDADYMLSASASAPIASNALAPTHLSYLDSGFDITPTSSLSSFAQASDLAPFEQAGGFGGGAATGHMLVTRAEVTDGTLRISFRQLGGQDTYVTAVIIYPEPEISIEEDLAEEIVEFLEKIAPAAGENLTAENILQPEVPIVDAVTIFSDASGGLPTPEAQSATPEADNTPGTSESASESSPTSSPASDPEPEPEVTTTTQPEGTPPPPEEDPTFTGTDPIPTPPTETPPTDTPPTDTPPTDTPPTDTPPTDTPPTDTPPTDTPPTDTPPTDTPPTDTPPTDTPPTDTPPTDTPPTDTPPTDEPPEETPPVSPPAPVPQTKELVLDAGGGGDEIYDPVILGNPIELDGCGSTFENNVICSLGDTSDFEIIWLLDGQQVGTGTQLTVQTGTGTQFDAVQSNINVSVQLRFDGLLISDGSIINVSAFNDTSGGPFLPGDIILTSLDTALISIIAAPVSEPGALFLLAPGLVYVVNRERRRRRKKQAV